MITNNLFRAFADFCTEVLFVPYDVLRFTEGWWGPNFFNAILFSITFVLLIYWLIQLQKFRKAGTEEF